MNIQALERSIEQQEVSRLVRRRARNLADALAYIARIPQGHALVALIGHGNERTNLEALQTWVDFELKQCGLCEDNELDYLYARLQMVLGGYEW